MTTKIGILLINLGTPASTSRRDVRNFLRTFLLDNRVQTGPAWLRYLVVYGIILPFRSKRTQHAYQQIWGAEGSPLLQHSKNLAQALQQQLGAAYQVELGMRYLEPSIDQALANLQAAGCREIKIIPLFPQYSSAVTGSAIAAALNKIAKFTVIPKITVLDHFYQHQEYIDAYAQFLTLKLQDQQPEMLLFSYHGLPQRALQEVNCQHWNANCAAKQLPCQAIGRDNTACYRAQCYATSRAIAAGMNLAEQQYQVSFQSRLGWLPWIEPYTENVLKKLAQDGYRRIAIACPSFVTDCLETLEEIGLRMQQHWKNLGGESLQVLPCLNSDQLWVNALAAMIGFEPSKQA